MKRTILFVPILILLLHYNSYCDDASNSMGFVVSGILSSSDESEKMYGADVHLNIIYISTSVEYAYWNKLNDSLFRGYVGLNAYGQLCQLQYGFGGNGNSFRIRSNISLTKKLFSGDFEYLLPTLLYPMITDDGMPRLTPILSIFGDFGEDFNRYGLGLGILF